MLMFAKLVSGELIIGELVGKEVRNSLKLNLLPDDKIFISPLIPFETYQLPTIKDSKIICKVPIMEQNHTELINTYYKIKEYSNSEKTRKLN